MEGKFIYDINRCVSCLACVSACKLINGGSVPWRVVLNSNPKGYPGLPVHNLSIACNHCENPSCVSSCPANAYSIDNDTGAVLLDSEKCIGCNYCYWNCPFDAPQYDRESGTIQKCHFCNERLVKRVEPACVSACPTGALVYSEDMEEKVLHGIIPETNLQPRISFIEPRQEPVKPKTSENSVINKVKLSSEWSLVIFSYLTSLLFSFSFSALGGQFKPAIGLLLALSVLTLIIPLIHLGQPLKAYRSVLNIRSSPLSQEIVALAIFIVLLNLSSFFNILTLWTLSFLAGLILLLIVDNVYNHADPRTEIRLHPGQIFLTGLTLASIFGFELRALIFIVLVKLILNVWVRFFRIRTRVNIAIGMVYMVLILSGIALLYIDTTPILAISVILAAELLNRVGYYIDFNPPGISNKFVN
jgi:Fe-S-cluster-containing dehydrogenase component